MLKIYIKNQNLQGLRLEDEHGRILKVKNITIEAAIRGNVTDALRDAAKVSFGERIKLIDQRYDENGNPIVKGKTQND